MNNYFFRKSSLFSELSVNNLYIFAARIVSPDNSKKNIFHLYDKGSSEGTKRITSLEIH